MFYIFKIYLFCFLVFNEVIFSICKIIVILFIKHIKITKSRVNFYIFIILLIAIIDCFQNINLLKNYLSTFLTFISSFILYYLPFAKKTLLIDHLLFDLIVYYSNVIFSQISVILFKFKKL